MPPTDSDALLSDMAESVIPLHFFIPKILIID
jgi:hypothetical protein